MTTDAMTIRTLGFTPRQAEVLSLALEGRTAASIAHVLTISPRTVEKHFEAIYHRLGVVNRIEAVMATLTALASAERVLPRGVTAITA
jgi:DNA-binding NarL/FixJ family response regulator